MLAWELAADIGLRLRELREVLDWTQGDLGREVGRGRQSVLLWESGRVSPPRRPLEDFCRRHHWPLEMFTEGGPRPRDVLLTRRDGAGTRRAKETLTGADGDTDDRTPHAAAPATREAERFLAFLEHMEAVWPSRAAGLDPAGVRELKVVAIREMIRLATEQGHPVPDFFYRVLHEIETP